MARDIHVIRPFQPPRYAVRVKRSRAGFGLFAGGDIPRGRTVIEYVGKLIPASLGDELEDRNRYIFNVNSRWDIDGSPRWNQARYINHSCRPNCEAITRQGRIYIVSRRAIRTGEELTYHYGKDYFDGYIAPAGCRCVKCHVA